MSQIMKTKTIATICAAFSILGCVAHAQTIQVSQGGILEQFQAYNAGSASFADLYDHHDWIYHGNTNGLPAVQTPSIMSFFVETNGELGFFHIYSDPHTSGSGQALTLIESNSALDFLVKDDSTDNDTYIENDLTHTYIAQNYWTTGLTDGFVLGVLDGEWEFEVGMELAPAISSWNVLGYENGSWTTIAQLDTGTAAIFSAVPEPSTIAFLALAGLGAIGAIRGRIIKQRKN